MFQVRVRGAKEVAQSIVQTAEAIAADFRAHLQTKTPGWENLLRATIQHVVYDPVAGRLRKYKPTMNLIKGVGSRVDTPNPMLTIAVVGDLRPVRLKRGNVSAGGSAIGDAPFEIEEGRMPDGWQGPLSSARPAYQMMLDAIRTDVYADAEVIVARHVR